MIKLYTHPICPKCLFLKQKLIKQGIEFKEINISKQEQLKEELIEKTGAMNLPIIFREGKYLVDPKIEDLI